MNKKAWSEKYLNPLWQRKRLEILARDNFRCRNCFSTDETLHVHHLYYKESANPWEYDNGALVTLCETCHASDHENSPEYQADLICTLKQAGFRGSSFKQFEFAIADALISLGIDDTKNTLVNCMILLKMIGGNKSIAEDFAKFIGSLGVSEEERHG